MLSLVSVLLRKVHNGMAHLTLKSSLTVLSRHLCKLSYRWLFNLTRSLPLPLWQPPLPYYQEWLNPYLLILCLSSSMLVLCLLLY